MTEGEVGLVEGGDAVQDTSRSISTVAPAGPTDALGSLLVGQEALVIAVAVAFGLGLIHALAPVTARR